MHDLAAAELRLAGAQPWDSVGAFFDDLGAERAAELELVTTDGASWIRTVVAALRWAA